MITRYHIKKRNLFCVIRKFLEYNHIKMNSIGEQCNELKKKYDDCFNSWFSEKFLKGHTDDTVCAGIFRVYQECVKTAMKEQNIEFKDVEENVLGTDKEFKASSKSDGNS